MIQYGTAILMEIGYGEAMRFHLFQAMRFHISQSHGSSISTTYLKVFFSKGSYPTAQSSTIPTMYCSEVMEYHSECQPLRDARGKTNKKITSDTYSDDDDFVNPPPVTLPIQKLETKVPPTHITETMACLNNEQRRCIQSIGFGSAITMKLRKLPRRLCYWVVDNYDPTTNSIRVADQNLLVTRKKVHEIYGFPLGDIQMSNPPKANSRNHVVKHWKAQLPKSIKRIRLSHVLDMIQKDTTGGPLFIMNFLVLFVSVMIGCPTMGTINQGFLENIPGGVDIKQLDWCGFVVSCLKSSRMIWKRFDEKCNYGGPIVFLLLFYIYVTRVESATIKSSRGELIHWTSPILNDRELEELSTGGFRNVVISSHHTNMNLIEQEEDGTEHEEDDDVAAPERDLYLLEIMREINFNFNTYRNTMTTIDTWLVRGIKKFPDSEELRMLVTKRNHEFNLACPYFPNYDVSHDGTFFNGVATPVHGREITSESKDIEFHEAAIEGDAHNDVVFSTPFTQVLNEEAFDIMEKVALAACSKNSKQQSLNPDNRGSLLEIKNGNVVPVTVVAPRRSKRHVQPTEKFRSPDMVFESKFGDLGYRGIFESMIPGSRIHATIIDISASILNHQERYRNKKSPGRMFLSCTLLVFFPVIDMEHYYLIVFNFKKHDCVIIDNIKSEVSDEVKYGNITYDVKILFTLYVDELNHKKANCIKRAKPMSGCMEWTTKYNNIDCGVFLMRHMETYKGEDLDKWNIGFETENEDNDDQHNQLDEMRKKYVSKILTWDLNVVKPFIYEMLASYDTLSDADKESFNMEEHIESRISLFC
ncbi:hypothetical protein L2E82_43962 [Cichorium intybus]|uniref:Uncharacterized protein n=1 Tax=Cichorium intybus TaxID=13427 RepID=A0ACB8ZPB9_CICIN|nr:hypothetical protein L2E82_43962 [Cichorium intybus]